MNTHDRDIVIEGLSRAVAGVDPTSKNRLLFAALAVLFAFLMTAGGFFAGFVLAFFTWFFTPDSPNRDWPALIVFAVSVIAGMLFGVYQGWQMYRRKMAEP